MREQMLHIFRNTPYGRETLLQSAYFCQQYAGLSLAIYVPTYERFMLRFESGPVMVILDKSYLFSPQTARRHVEEILGPLRLDYDFLTPAEHAAKELPELPTDFMFMSCPRVVSAQSSRIGLGHIGPKVRGIVSHASFPVLIPGGNFKPWENVAVFFGGSEMGARAVELGIAVARVAQRPFTIFTQLDGATRDECEQMLARRGLLERIREPDGRWVVFEHGSLDENLFTVPHDALVVIGARGHRLLRDLVFGSTLERVQRRLPNPLLVVGPHWRPHL